MDFIPLLNKILLEVSSRVPVDKKDFKCLSCDQMLFTKYCCAFFLYFLQSPRNCPLLGGVLLSRVPI